MKPGKLAAGWLAILHKYNAARRHSVGWRTLNDALRRRSVFVPVHFDILGRGEKVGWDKDALSHRVQQEPLSAEQKVSGWFLDFLIATILCALASDRSRG